MLTALLALCVDIAPQARSRCRTNTCVARRYGGRVAHRYAICLPTYLGYKMVNPSRELLAIRVNQQPPFETSRALVASLMTLNYASRSPSVIALRDKTRRGKSERNV